MIMLNSILNDKVGMLQLYMYIIPTKLMYSHPDYLSLQILETSIGLYLIWDGVYKVQVYLPETFSNTVCGLCGDMDDTPDEYVLQDGGTVRNKT